MPRSKRAKVVRLNKVSKKNGKDRKSQLIEDVRAAVEKYERAIVLEVENQRNVFMHQIRDELKPGRLFQGKNKVMQVALGSKPQDEIEENTHGLAALLHGHRGVLFTDASVEDVESILRAHEIDDYAKSGSIATETVVLQEGPDSLAAFQHTMEPYFRKLGLPTVLKDGKIVLMGDATICTEGEELTVEAAQLVKLLGYKMATFRVKLVGWWDKASKEIVEL